MSSLRENRRQRASRQASAARGARRRATRRRGRRCRSSRTVHVSDRHRQRREPRSVAVGPPRGPIGRRGGGTASRRSRVPTATWVSRRASAAPRQAWTPAPKARWPSARRPRSKRSGSGKRAGSRFAAPSSSTTSAPRGIRLVGQRDVRLGDPPGALDRALPAQRPPQSPRAEPGRLAEPGERVGVPSSAQTVVPIRLTRGLRPGHEQRARPSRPARESLRRPSCSAASIDVLTRSDPGSARRAATSSRT